MEKKDYLKEELSKEEKSILKVIIKNTRVDYFRKNKYILEEKELKEELLYSNDKMEKDLENKLDKEFQADKFENIFSDKSLSKFAKALTYNEKLVLSLYYVENKSDEQIGKILFMTRSAVNKKRHRAIEKIKNECKKRGMLNV